MNPELSINELEIQIDLLKGQIQDQTCRLGDFEEELKMRVKCNEKKDASLVRVEQIMKIKDFIAHSPLTTFVIFGILTALLAFLSQ